MTKLQNVIIISGDAGAPQQPGNAIASGPPPGFSAQNKTQTPSAPTLEAVNGKPQNGVSALSDAHPRQQGARAVPEVQENVGATLGQARAQGAAKAKLMERLVDSNRVSSFPNIFEMPWEAPQYRCALMPCLYSGGGLRPFSRRTVVDLGAEDRGVAVEGVAGIDMMMRMTAA